MRPTTRMTSLLSRMKRKSGIDPVVGQRADDDVELAQPQPADQPVGKAGVDREADVGVLPHHASDRLGQMPAQPGRAGADAGMPQSCRRRCPTTSERASASCVSISLTWRSSALPGFGQLDAAAAAMVEPGAELALEAMHALGEPRLGDVHGLRRVAQIEPLGRGKEELELAIVHDYVPSVMIPLLSVNCGHGSTA